MESGGRGQYYEKKDLTVMVNNSTDINKTNNHLSPQITEHKDHGMNLYDVENPGPVWNRHEYVAVLNRLMRSQPFVSSLLDPTTIQI